MIRTFNRKGNQRIHDYYILSGQPCCWNIRLCSNKLVRLNDLLVIYMLWWHFLEGQWYQKLPLLIDICLICYRVFTYFYIAMMYLYLYHDCISMSLRRISKLTYSVTTIIVKHETRRLLFWGASMQLFHWSHWCIIIFVSLCNVSYRLNVKSLLDSLSEWKKTISVLRYRI